MSPSLISLALCGLLVPSLAVQIFTNQTIPTNITNACANALLADVKCSPMVSFLRYTDYYMNSTLNNTCTTACTSALGSYAAGVSQNCNGQQWNGYTGDLMPISLIPTLLQYNYNYTCLTDSGRYCNNVAAQAAWAADPSSGDPVYGSSVATGSVATAPKNVSLCDLCLVKNLKFQAERPYYNGPDLVSAYASRTSSCSIKSLALSTTAASFTLAPSTAPTQANCTKSYTIQKGDTCYSISKAQSIGTGWLLMDNNLPAYCSNFPTNGTLCVKDTCKVYTVASNDTCGSIAAKYNITQSQLISFNPVILPGCYNLDRMNGTSLCVSAPGPQYTPPTQTNLAPLTPTTPAPVPANARDNSTRNCGMWYNVAQGDYCNMIVLKFGISLPDFTFLNPTINSNCTNLLSGISYCVEPVGDINTYPGRPGVISASTPATYTPWTALPAAATTTSAPSNTTKPLPLANGTRDDCNFYFAGDVFQTKPAFWSSTCALAANSYKVDLTSFGTWNTALNVSDPNCSFQKGQRYCGKLYFGSQPDTDSMLHGYPLRNGTIATCSYYADVTPGTTCQNVLDTYAITIAQFYKWNPTVGSDCTGLQLQYSYCVAAPDDNSVSTTTVSGKPTTTTSGAPSPTAPTQSGEPTNCVKWDVAVSGDDCDKMSNRNYITRAQFLKWNPAVNSDCSSGFWAGYDYCVGTSDTVSSTRSSTTAATSTTSAVPAPTPNQANNAVSNCNKYAAAQSGDYCSAFADRNGITLTNLYAWNSVLKSDGSGCSNNFWAGYYYCTGVSTSK